MDVIRFGLGVRALRHRRGWRQEDLAAAAGVSRSLIARVERGHADRVTVRQLARIVEALGARIDVRVLWHGEMLDRLLDARHAELVERLVTMLRPAGWDSAVEVTFNSYGERGSIDVLAFHRASRCLLVVEVKSVVPDLQAMLMVLDRKVRLAGRAAGERGWHASTVSRLLVLPEDRTARRRVADHGATFATALPDRNVAIRRWLQRPVGTLAGLLFLTDGTPASARHRVSRGARSR